MSRWIFWTWHLFLVLFGVLIVSNMIGDVSPIIEATWHRVFG